MSLRASRKSKSGQMPLGGDSGQIARSGAPSYLLLEEPLPSKTEGPHQDTFIIWTMAFVTPIKEGWPSVRPPAVSRGDGGFGADEYRQDSTGHKKGEQRLLFEHNEHWRYLAWVLPPLRAIERVRAWQPCCDMPSAHGKLHMLQGL